MWPVGSLVETLQEVIKFWSETALPKKTISIYQLNRTSTRRAAVGTLILPSPRGNITAGLASELFQHRVAFNAHEIMFTISICIWPRIITVPENDRVSFCALDSLTP